MNTPSRIPRPISYRTRPALTLQAAPPRRARSGQHMDVIAPAVKPKTLAPVAKPLTERPKVVRSARPVLPQTSEQPARRRVKRLRKLPVATKVMYSMAAVLMLVGTGVVVQGMLTNQEVSEQVGVLAASDGNSSGTVDVPSEEKPAGDYVGAYRVAPQLPRIIRIQKFSVAARVLQVGVDTSNQLQAPKNIYDTGWYMGSSRPGEGGAVVIDGHYSGPTTNGVFSKLERLVAGDEISVERGDGQVFTYVVQQVETKPVGEIDMSKLLVSYDTKTPGLNLITCGGNYDNRSFTYDQRTVVYALQK